MPLPDPDAGVTVNHGSGDAVAQWHAAGVVMLMVPVAPEEGTDITPVELSDAAHCPVRLESAGSGRKARPIRTTSS